MPHLVLLIALLLLGLSLLPRHLLLVRLLLALLRRPPLRVLLSLPTELPAISLRPSLLGVLPVPRRLRRLLASL